MQSRRSRKSNVRRTTTSIRRSSVRRSLSRSIPTRRSATRVVFVQPPKAQPAAPKPPRPSKAQKKKNKKNRKNIPGFGMINRVSAGSARAKAYATTIALPEVTTPVRFPTLETGRPTAVFGPMPRETRKDLGVVTPVGTPVIKNGQAFMAITSNPHCSEISHVIPGGVSRYNFQNFIPGGTTPTTSFVPTVAGTASGFPWRPSQATPDGSDATSVHDERYICPRACNRRGFWFGRGQSLVFSSSNLATIYINMYRWDGDDWVQINGTQMNAAAAAAVPVGLTNTSNGYFLALDLTVSAGTVLTAWMVNSTYAGGAAFTNLPTNVASGTTETLNTSQEMFTFKTVPKLSSYLGSYEAARINAASLRFTCIGTAFTNGGAIDQVQLPQGETIADLLGDINTRAGDALSILATYPGRRYEAVKAGTYAPMIPDGQAYSKFREIVDINLGGTIQDIWWDLDKRMTILSAAASSPVPTSGTPANQVVCQTFDHMETFCTNLAFPTATAKGTFEELQEAVRILQSIRTTTENPSHLSEIIHEIWADARPFFQQVGPAMMMLGAGKGAPGAVLTAAGAIATALSQVSL